jgi:hypothetical protein
VAAPGMTIAEWIPTKDNGLNIYLFHRNGR